MGLLRKLKKIVKKVVKSPLLEVGLSFIPGGSIVGKLASGAGKFSKVVKTTARVVQTVRPIAAQLRSVKSAARYAGLQHTIPSGVAWQRGGRLQNVHQGNLARMKRLAGPEPHGGGLQARRRRSSEIRVYRGRGAGLRMKFGRGKAYSREGAAPITRRRRRRAQGLRSARARRPAGVASGFPPATTRKRRLSPFLRRGRRGRAAPPRYRSGAL